MRDKESVELEKAKLEIWKDKEKGFEIWNQEKHDLPFIIDLPHSGCMVSKGMYQQMLDNVVLSNMDWYLPQLYYFLKELGFTTIVNHISRYEIDPNRSLKDRSPKYSYSKNLVYWKTTFGDEIYPEQLTREEVDRRIKDIYSPYHEQIEKAIAEKKKHFDKVYLLDLHSFGKDVSADIVLGNSNGKTTSDYFFQKVSDLLEAEGFCVKHNVPYSGGYITRYYGSSPQECEALQIELSYNAYIDKRNFGKEEFPTINEQVFKEAQEKMRHFFEQLKGKGKVL